MTTSRASTRLLVAMFVTCTLLVGSESPATGQAATTWKVSHGAVALLARPTGGSTVLASAPTGTTLRLIGSSGEWVRVTTSDASGVPATGWVRAQDLRNATGVDPLAAPAPAATTVQAVTKPVAVTAEKASPLVSAAAAAKTAAALNAPAVTNVPVTAAPIAQAAPATTSNTDAKHPAPTTANAKASTPATSATSKTPTTSAAVKMPAPVSASTAKTPVTTTASATMSTPVKTTSTPVKAVAAKTPAPKTTTASTTAARRPAPAQPTAAAAVTQAPVRVAAISPIVPARPLTMPATYLVPAQPPVAFASFQVGPSSASTNPLTPRRNIVSNAPRPRTPGLGGPFRLMGMGAMSQRTAGFVFEGQVSVRVASWLELTAEGGQLSDVMSPSSRAAINATSAALSEIAGQSVVVDARAPAAFGMAGARFVSNVSHVLRPYISTTGGMAFVTPRVRFVNNGQEITAIAGTTFQEKANSLMIGVATGVYIPVGKFAALDLGYRTVRGFDHGASSFSLNQAIFGIGTRF